MVQRKQTMRIPASHSSLRFTNRMSLIPIGSAGKNKTEARTLLPGLCIGRGPWP